jgi:hypothetical protein
MNDLGLVQVAIFENQFPSIDSVLQTRDSIGGVSSGVWLIGAARAKEPVIERIVGCNVHGDPLLFVAAELHETINTAFVIDEGDQVFILVRTAAVPASPFEALLSAIAPSHS